MRTRVLSARTFLVLASLTLCAALSASAQYSIVYTFPTGSDVNAYPNSALIADSQGNLYGTAGRNDEFSGGVFELTPVGNGIWTENFYSGLNTDGGNAPIGLVLDPNTGNLYGVVASAGTGKCGYVYQLTPPSANDGSWSQAVIYNFACGDDGNEPYAALIRDSAGRLYGTTIGGGSAGLGVVFMLTPPSQSGGSWTEQVLHSFLGHGDGGFPQSPLFMDSSGAVYGVTPYETVPDRLWGTAFKLTATKSGPWAETVMHRFYGGQVSNTDGGLPIGPLAVDSSGAVYGATEFGGEGCPPRVHIGCGTVFQLVPPSTNGGEWTENLIYQFTGELDGAGPGGGVVFNSTGMLYGTTGAAGKETGGTIFTLSPPSVGGGSWTITSFPVSEENRTGVGVLLLGNDIFGTAMFGGSNRMGSVFKLEQ